MAVVQSLLTPSLLAALLAIVTAQYELRINVSISPELNSENLVTVICYYHSNTANQSSATDDLHLEVRSRSHRDTNAIAFTLNGTTLSTANDRKLTRYTEWDFEYGAMSQFVLEKTKSFVGTFLCKTQQETSPTAQLIYFPVGNGSENALMALYSLIAACCIELVFLVVAIAICMYMCYVSRSKKKTSCIETAKNISQYRKELNSPETGSGSGVSNKSSRYPASTANVCYSNLLQIPAHLTDLHTGQLEPQLVNYHPPAKSNEELKQSYIDSPDEITFDVNGGKYVNEDHEIELYVPQFAVPMGRQVTVRIAVSLITPLHFPVGWKPVSPVVHVCVLDDPNFKFDKPVKITIPHFLSISPTDSDNTVGLQFLKAGHGQSLFQEADGEASFEVGRSYGTLHTDHFCHYCITSNVSNFSKVNFRLIRITPRKLSSTWKAQFCVTYFLRTCLRSLEKFYDASEYEVTSLRRFTFSDSLPNAYLRIYFERKLAGGWNLSQDGGSDKVMACEVDFWGKEVSVLKQDEEEELYPPRFIVKVNGNQASEVVTASISFFGAKEDLQTELSLEPTPHVQQGEIVQRHYQVPFDSRYRIPESLSLPSLSVTNGGAQDNHGPLQSQMYSRDARLTRQSRSGSRYSLIDPRVPSLPFLMNNTAVISSKWRAIGIQLCISFGKLEQIEHDHPKNAQRCLSEVYSHWERQPTGVLPYEWSSIFEALNSPQVSENKLARDMELLVSATASNISLSSNYSSQTADSV